MARFTLAGNWGRLGGIETLGGRRLADEGVFLLAALRCFGPDKSQVAPKSGKPMSTDLFQNYEGHGDLLTELKDRIRSAQVKAALAVNRELVLLYWSIGRDILERQQLQGWGAKVLQQLSKDLRRSFPSMKGLSFRNLNYMRMLARAWSDESIVQQLVAQIPWGHNIRLLEKVKDPAERRWYLQACIKHGWSRDIMMMQIETGLYRREGQAITNFERTLPAHQSDLAQQTIKDPYCFRFLMLDGDSRERETEQALVNHLQKFLVELGIGFAFLGRQQRIEVGGDEFFIDLLFYHVKLHAYVVVELKATDFKPEYAGQLNFYVTAINEMLCTPEDHPTIGLLLCRGKNRLVAEWSLKGIDNPIGVSEYELTEALPDDLKGKLPSIEQLESELDH